jgi:hypothetical protein
LLLGSAQLAFEGGWIIAIVVPLITLLATAVGLAGVAGSRVIMRRRSGRRATAD